MTNELQTQEWYTHLVEECKAIITEATFTSRWALVEGYWNLGKRIYEETKTHPNILESVQGLAQSIGLSTRTLYYANQTYSKYPNLQELPEGKNISWNKLITKYLPDPRAEIVLPNGFQLPENVEIRHEDFRKSQFEDNSIDLIITDPPYPGEFIELWSDLSKLASRVLKPSGFLIAYSGQIHLPEVMQRLSENMTYYWTFALYHEGLTQLIMPRNVICRWKPILIYQKPPFKKLTTVLQDYIISEKREKEDHEWQQSESGAKKLIEYFSDPGNTILDPFSGAGTFVKVGHELKRKSIGIEIDENAYKSSLLRI